MSSRDDELDAERLRAIFEEEIRFGLDDVAPALAGAEPLLVIVGAQPGAGKSREISRVRSQHPEATKVIGDDLRVFHPDYRRLLRSDPLRMPEVTAKASGAWVEMSIAYLRERRRSVILETTMRQPAVVEGTVRAFREAGYRIEVRALAVPLEVSRLGTVSRYFEAVREHGSGRWTPSQAHEDASGRMLDTLGKIIGDGLVDHVVVADRGGRILHDRDVDARATAVVDAVEAVRAVEAGRRLGALDPVQAEHWLNSFLVEARFAAQERPTDADVLRTLHRLGRDAEAVAGAAFPHDLRRRGDVIAQVRNAVQALPPAAGGGTGRRLLRGPGTGPLFGEDPDRPAVGPAR